jgi:SpoVK/Ycf46/Vps4 family AAA+-type ATPase
MEFTQKFKNYYKAHYPSLFILTHEEERVVKDLLELFSNDQVTKLHAWDAQRGLVNLKDNNQNHPEGLNNSTELLKYLQGYREEDNIFILKDFHLHFDKVINIRLLRNLWNILKSKGNMIVLVGHKFAIPAEMEKEIQLIDYDLPGVKSIGERLDYIIDSVNKAREDKKMEIIEVPQDIKEAAIEAAKGMTFGEIENAFAMAYTSAKTFNKEFTSTVFDEKIQQLKKNGLLTYIPSDISFDNVGGLSGLKSWIHSRKKAYTQEAREYKLPLPKGILIASVPGTGKTLISKSIAKEFDCPLFQFDMGSVFDSHVGNSERNMREAIKVIESIGKCVILIDEIEKSLSKDAVSGKGDTGVSSRIFGTFLGWLNDRTNPAFIVATSNDHTILPSPLIRKGRFDQLFWVDLPSEQERKEIFSVVLKKYGRTPDNYNLKKFVDESDEFTGAEIEDVIKSALFRAFYAGKEISDKEVLAELDEFIPFAHSHEEDLQIMRKQARGKLVMLNDEGETQTVETAMRKLSISMD